MKVNNFFDISYMKISELMKDICEYRKNFDEDEMYFFKQNMKEFYRFNPKGEILEYYTINSLQNQGYLPSICKIGKSNLFVYGGYSNNCMNSTFIINTSNFSIQELPQGIDSHAAAGQLFSGRIYVFGGTNNQGNLSQSRYFDLIKKEWESISPLPSVCVDTSTLLLDQEILISGCQNIMFVYNISTNQYKNLNNGLQISNQNILIHNFGRIFLLTNSNIYICEDWKGKKNWRQFCSGFSFERTTSKPCFNGKFAYFFTQSNKIYRFDCEIGPLTMIKQF